MEDIKNGFDGCKSYMLDLFSKKVLKFRDLDGRVDLFFTNQDLFVFLNKTESEIFRKVIINDDFNPQNEQERQFLSDLYNEQKDSLYYELADFYWLYASKKDYSSESAFLLSQIQQHHPSAKTLLDIGCGQGYHLWHLHDAGYDVMGIDKSDEQIAAAKKRLPHMSFKAMDFLCDNINQSFDVNLILWNTLLYFSPPANLNTVFSRVKKNLNTDGIVLIDFRSFEDHIKNGEFQEKLVRDLEEDNYHMHLETANQIDSQNGVLIENTTTSIYHNDKLIKEFKNDPVYLNIVSLHHVKKTLAENGLHVEAILDGDSLYRNEVKEMTKDTRSYFLVARNSK